MSKLQQLALTPKTREAWDKLLEMEIFKRLIDALEEQFQPIIPDAAKCTEGYLGAQLGQAALSHRFVRLLTHPEMQENAVIRELGDVSTLLERMRAQGYRKWTTQDIEDALVAQSAAMKQKEEPKP